MEPGFSREQTDNLTKVDLHMVADYFTNHVPTYLSAEQINIREQIPRYLNGQAKLLTTRCIIIETEKISKKTQGALSILKQYGIHECGHKEPLPGSKCIMSMLGKYNDNHYVLASQDRDLQEKLRLRAGVPLLYLHNKSPTLEKPCKASYDKVNAITEANSAVFISECQNEALAKMKKAFGVEEAKSEPVLKKKKLHNPNPLSCKKKKKATGQKVKPGVNKEGKVRKRKKKKIPKHLKDKIKALG